MAVRYSPTVANSGFDRSVRPDFQMVPLGGTRVLTVTGSHGLVPRVRNPVAGTSVLTAVKSGTGANVRLTLTGGVDPGRVFVEWVTSAGFVGAVSDDFTLEVSVKREKTVNTAFHYVDDGRRQVTTRRIADLDTLIAGVNAILTPQANVTMARKSADPRPVAENLGRVVRFVSADLQGPPHNIDPAQHEWDILLALADTTAHFNVFFVREYEQDADPTQDLADAGTIASDKMCIFEDRQGHNTAAALAHELVHGLGVHDHARSSSNLMATGRRGIGRFVGRDQINTINTSGT